MSKVLTDPKHYTDIADAIRAHLGVETTYLPSEMAAAIGTIPDGANVATGSFTPTKDSDNARKYSKSLRDAPITISGLPFKPTRVYVFTMSVPDGGGDDNALLAFDSDTKSCLYASPADDDEDGYYDDYKDISGGYGDIMSTYGATPYRMEFTEDGFTLCKSSRLLIVGPYYYTAIG